MFNVRISKEKLKHFHIELHYSYYIVQLFLNDFIITSFVTGVSNIVLKEGT